jgi:hypothetical protein
LVLDGARLRNVFVNTIGPRLTIVNSTLINTRILSSCGTVVVRDSTVTDVASFVQHNNGAFFGNVCGKSARTTLVGNVIERVGIAIDQFSDHSVIAHGNSFVSVGTLANTISQTRNPETFDLRGNFIGDRTLSTSAAGVFARTAAGRSVNVPQVNDALDNPARALVELDDLLPAPATSPGRFKTFVTAPSQRARYRASVPAAIDSDDGAVELAPAQEADDAIVAPGAGFVARCKWFRLPGGSAVTARADDPARVRLSVDANGTFDDTFAVGEHLVAAQCVHSTSLVDLHVARFVVDETRVAGRLPSGVTTWSGAVTITGDVTVPDDASLVIEPGTSVNIATTDDLRGSFFIDNPNAGSRNDDADNTLNRDFGRRDVIDMVTGTALSLMTACKRLATSAINSSPCSARMSLRWCCMRASSGSI